MEMSVREARAQFAHALSIAERGERVTITKNGRPIAEIGPPTPPPAEETEDFWARNERIRRELGLDRYDGPPLDDKWLEEFNDPAWTRELFGPDYFDDEPDPAAR